MNEKTRPTETADGADMKATATVAEASLTGHGDRDYPEGTDKDAPTTRIERISRRAYEIYESRGGEHGRSLEDWLQAEREIDGE